MNPDAPLYRGVNPYLLQHYLPKGEKMDTWLMTHMKKEVREKYSPIRRGLRKLYWCLRYPVDSFMAPMPSGVMYAASLRLPVNDWKTVAFALKDYLEVYVKNPLVRGNITKTLDDHIQKMLGGYGTDTHFLACNGCIDLRYANADLCWRLQCWRRDWMVHMSKQLADNESERAFYVYGGYNHHV